MPLPFDGAPVLTPTLLQLKSRLPVSCPVGLDSSYTPDTHTWSLDHEHSPAAHPVMTKSGRPGVPVGRHSLSRQSKFKQRRHYRVDSSVHSTLSRSSSVDEYESDGRPQRRLHFDKRMDKDGLTSMIIKLPDTVRMEETWTLYVFSPSCVIIESKAKASDVPFADYFLVVTRYVVD